LAVIASKVNVGSRTLN